MLPSWWRWLAVVLLGGVLAGFFALRGGKHDEGVIIDYQEPPKPLAGFTSPKIAKRLSDQKEARIPQELSAKVTAQSMEETRRKLTEEREFVRTLQTEPARELLSRLLTLWSEPGVGSRASEEKALVTMVLTQALHSSDENSNGPVYQQLSALLGSDALPLATKMEIASILGSVQTPQSVQLILGAYQQASDDKLREILGNQAGRTGDNLWAGRFHEDLSPPLEAAWPLAKDNSKLAQALANGLAKVGTPTGVQLLVNEILHSAQTIQDLSDLKDLRGQAAFLALNKVRNPNAVSIFANGLLNADSSELERYVCGLSLAAMGKAEATQVLLRWAATASDQETPWAEQWFGKMRDAASFDLVGASLSPANGVKFASATIQSAVVAGQKNRER